MKNASWSSPYAVLGCLTVVAIADLVIWRVHVPYFVQGLLDEPAHAATGLLVLLAVCVAPTRPTVLAVLAGSVLIDLDHIPHVLGSSILDHGVPRPYPHSLLTLVVLGVVVTLAVRDTRRRTIVAIVTAAVAVHLIRDIAEPGGPGAALLWPLSDRSVSIPYLPYGLAIMVLAVVALARRRPAATHAADSPA